MVTKNASPYTIVGVSLAKVIRCRFASRENYRVIVDSCWWLMIKEESKDYIKYNQMFAYDTDKENS